MIARWTSFAVGLALLLAPLVLGYGEVGPILHDVAVGLLVCIGTVAAIEWAPARYALAAPAAWLVWTGRGATEPAAGVAEMTAGAALLVLAFVPGARAVPRLGRVGREDRPDHARA
ncbi:conserved hypothetical protein [Anaeromyxobacter sp. K]|uniref:hypothetical protein n=1 Tax=Anaeromyxobacter sp. (strain K) TaxID=447217 RepID=UPI00015F8E23|nr:hypothetical protein [Anaeromyxobacter sp. K]ACG75070.1 conserved hypothetical protein [Anaeromyxobacter sp. K]